MAPTSRGEEKHPHPHPQLVEQRPLRLGSTEKRFGKRAEHIESLPNHDLEKKHNRLIKTHSIFSKTPHVCVCVFFWPSTAHDSPTAGAQGPEACVWVHGRRYDSTVAGNPCFFGRAISTISYLTWELYMWWVRLLFISREINNAGAVHVISTILFISREIKKNSRGMKTMYMWSIVLLTWHKKSY